MRHLHSEEPACLESDFQRKVKRRKKLLARLRLGVVLFAVGSLWYLGNRYELVTLPVDACSPVASFEPGTKLLVDRQPQRIWLRDVVLYKVPGGGLGLGRVVSPPGTELGTLCTADGYWIRGDVKACDVLDSRTFGALAEQAIVARVLFSVAF